MQEMQKQVRNSKSYRDINEEIVNECQRVKEEWLIQKCVRMEHFFKTNQTNEMRRDIKHFEKKKKTRQQADVSRTKTEYLPF